MAGSLPAALDKVSGKVEGVGGEQKGMEGGVGRVMRVGRRGTMNKGNALWKCGDATNGLHIFVR